MSKLTMGVLIGALMAGVTYAAAATLVGTYHTASRYTPVDYANAERLAASEYQVARARCEAIERRQREFCVAQAHTAERRARAEAENRFRGTSKSRLDVRVAAAEADWLAWEACNDQSGRNKVCAGDARAKQAKAGTRLQGRAQVAMPNNERNPHGI